MRASIRRGTLVYASDLVPRVHRCIHTPLAGAGSETGDYLSTNVFYPSRVNTTRPDIAPLLDGIRRCVADRAFQLFITTPRDIMD